jgi:acetate---CoA ligase (ADP-forming)
MANLDALYRPKSIAIIGASNRPLTIGYRIMVNLMRYGFKGPIYPVNPKAEPILEKTSYKSILEVPGEVDLAHVIVKNTLVAQTLEECAKKGVKVAIINTSGFKETGEEGAKMERELQEIGRRTGVRLFGPNCQGVMNTDPEVSLYSNFTFAPMTPGHVSIVAQGGGVAEVINNYFGMNGVGQRMYTSNGNACDISVPEVIEYYGADPKTHVIVLHVESFADPKEFLERVRPVAQKKPVLALKSGVTPEGARAVSSHTGGLMAQDTVTDVLFDKCGVLRFSSLSELCDAAQAFATQKVPKGNRLGMVTNAGSPAIIVTDEAVKAGLKVPDLSPASKEFLKQKLQAIASVANPIDMMATASGTEFGVSLQAILDDPNIDMAVVCFMTPFFVDTKGIAQAIEEQSKRTDKTLLAVAMTNPNENPEWKETTERVRRAGVPVYYFPEVAARVLTHMDRFRRLRDRPQVPAPRLNIDGTAASRILKEAKPSPEGFLSLRDATALLSAYGIPLAKGRFVKDGEEALSAARELRFPVVLKADAPTLIHKTEAKAVVLNLADEKALEEAFAALSKRLEGTEGLSYLVQKQLQGGIEVIVGGAKAPGLGSMVMFGVGGIFVEVYKDVIFKLAPLSLSEAEQMQDEISGAALLRGIRGKPGVDRSALTDILLRVSALLTDHPEITELDLNPILAFPPGIPTCGVDARVKIARNQS